MYIAYYKLSIINMKLVYYLQHIFRKKISKLTINFFWFT